MTELKTIWHVFFLTVLLAGVSGCTDLNMKKTAAGVTFSKVGEFSGQRGQSKIVLVVYSGEAKEGNIKEYAKKLGCQMVFAYYYPDSTDRNEIPVQRMQEAENFVEARDVLFQGEGVGNWHFASQCLGMAPHVTDCQEYPISTYCR